jgi:hypothetical protein
MALPQRRKGFQYRIVIHIGPVENVPVFGGAVARIIGVLKRAGHDVEVHIEELGSGRNGTH